MSKYSETLEFLVEMRDLNIPLSKEGQLAEAESMFNMMKNDGLQPDVIAYTAEHWEKAFAVFEEMELKSCPVFEEMKVMQWMEDARVPPSAQMYKDIEFFAQTSSGSENAAAIRERLDALRSKHGYSTAEDENNPSLPTNDHQHKCVWRKHIRVDVVMSTSRLRAERNYLKHIGSQTSYDITSDIMSRL